MLYCAELRQRHTPTLTSARVRPFSSCCTLTYTHTHTHKQARIPNKTPLPPTSPRTSFSSRHKHKRTRPRKVSHNLAQKDHAQSTPVKQRVRHTSASAKSAPTTRSRVYSCVRVCVRVCSCLCLCDCCAALQRGGRKQIADCARAARTHRFVHSPHPKQTDHRQTQPASQSTTSRT